MWSSKLYRPYRDANGLFRIGARPRRHGFTLVELVVVIAIVAVLLILILPAMSRAHKRPRGACQTNLKQLGMIFKLYAGENPAEIWPRIHGDEWFGTSQAANCVGGHADADYSPDMRAIFPDYCVDVSILICPQTKEANRYFFDEEEYLNIVQDDGTGLCQYTGQITDGDASYTYLGYALDMTEDADGTIDSSVIGLPPGTPRNTQFAFTIAKIKQCGFGDKNADNDGPLDLDLNLSSFPGGSTAGIAGTSTVRRLREGIERFILTDLDNPGNDEYAQSRFPVLWDNVSADSANAASYNHVPAGSNTLYMDGHVLFNKYPGKFPANKSVTGLASLIGAQ
jgi:prepilin-type N-terminal cleavage/methylation domain-containing protein/prepilin-type processing-associated H-X9-DG protein